MKNLSLAFLIYICCASLAFAQKPVFYKMSPLVRRLATEYRMDEQKAKGLKGANGKEKAVVAFVRCEDARALENFGCKVLASFDDIHIARIPLHSLAPLSQSADVSRIEAGRQGRISMDTTRYVVNAHKAQGERLSDDGLSFSGYTGSNVVVGVQDICFDLTHSTFWSHDGKHYRIKAFWDHLAKRDSAETTLPVGREYLSEQDILDCKHSADAFLDYHGTHTAGIAAGSGWNGSGMSRFVGMAPDADICLVCNCCSDNSQLADPDYAELYTDAMDVLGFKYIFDYAERVGKPCVINFSEGRAEDFYAETMYYEAVERLLGPGRILCASAGNMGTCKTYLRKPEGRDSVSSFIHAWNGTSAIFMRSSDEFSFSLSFYLEKGNEQTHTYTFDDVRNEEDMMLYDTLEIADNKYVVLFCVYPSGFNADDWGVELYLIKSDNSRLGYTDPVRLTVKGAETDVEMYSSVGELWARKDLFPQSVDAEMGHFVFFPGASKNVICVGSVSHQRTIRNYKDDFITFVTAEDGGKSYFSSMGPTLQGFVKPDVMAPGENIISAMSSYYMEAKADSYTSVDDVEVFQNEGRNYAWHATSGTSMAAPVVTGAVALWLDACPTLSPQQVLDVIEHTSKRRDGMLYPNNSYGWGEIDVKAGLDYVLSTYCGIVDITQGSGNRRSAKKEYYDLNGRRLPSINGLHGLFLVSDEKGEVRKIAQ